jgi:hypothetical protein
MTFYIREFYNNVSKAQFWIKLNNNNRNFTQSIAHITVYGSDLTRNPNKLGKDIMTLFPTRQVPDTPLMQMTLPPDNSFITGVSDIQPTKLLKM